MKRRTVLATIPAAILTACGGGMGETGALASQMIEAPSGAYQPKMSMLVAKTTPLAVQGPASTGGPLRSAPNLYGGVDAFVAIEQLLNYGEAHYPTMFPGHPQTLVYAPFRYRVYPSGVMLAVAVNVPVPGFFVEAGVYAIVPSLWGENNIQYVGHVLDFITPVPSGPQAFALSLATGSPHITTTTQGSVVEIVVNSTHMLALAPNGWPGGVISVTPSSGISPAFSVGYLDWNTRTQLRLIFSGAGGGRYTAAFTLPDITGATATLQVLVVLPIA